MILLVTNREDLTCDYVILELEKRRISFCRMNTEDLPSRLRFYQDIQSESGVFYLEDKKFMLSDVRGIYYRRPKAPEPPESVIDSGIQAYCRSEWLALLENWYATLDGPWLNHPFAIRRAESKMLQLQRAKRLGFRIPSTLIANHPEEIACFIRGTSGNVIAKPLKTSLIEKEGQAHVIFTTRLDKAVLAAPEMLTLNPVILQEEIPKACDIRVTVVGDEIFAVAIDSQAHKDSEVDWRKGDAAKLVHSVHELPPALRRQCAALVKSLDLRFGAIDLVQDIQGEYHFLEINPNGQWAWLEAQTGLPIAKAIVDELTGHHVLSHH